MCGSSGRLVSPRKGILTAQSKILKEPIYWAQIAQRQHVRFGPKAAIPQCNRHVCFTPESRHLQCSSRCPLWANNGHHAHLLDYFVGSGEQLIWNRKAERLCSLEVEYQIEFRRLHDRQVGGFCPLENAACVHTKQAVCFGKTGAIGSQGSVNSEQPKL